MKKTVGCFTEEKLQELSNQPNTVVYQPTHDVLFEPWPAQKVSIIMDLIVEITKKNNNKEDIEQECQRIPDIRDFSQKYKVMYEKLIDSQFVQDTENLRVIKQLIMMKAAVDKNLTTSEAAQAQASDIALKSLSSRVKNAKSK